MQAMRKRSVKLWRLNEDGRLIMKWSLFLATAERGVYFATYRGSFLAPEAALESDAGALAA